MVQNIVIEDPLRFHSYFACDNLLLLTNKPRFKAMYIKRIIITINNNNFTRMTVLILNLP